ncbi:STT3 domain-containing protein [Nanoarchaeota archaeon]
MSKENDDEITLDLSKIFGFLKPSKKPESDDSESKSKERESKEKESKKHHTKEHSDANSETHHTEHKKEHHKAEHHKEHKTEHHHKAEESSHSKSKKEEQDEISIDIQSIKKFLVKHKTLILLLIPLIFSLFLRVQTADLGATDVWAANSVYGGMKSNIEKQINQQYPNLPPQSRSELVNENFEKLKSEHKEEINQQIKQASDYYKSRFQDENGDPYILDLDSYFWIRYVENIVEKGYPADEKLPDGTYRDNHMWAPKGVKYNPSLHPWSGAIFHKIWSIFNSKATPMRSFFFISLPFALLTVLGAFFIGRRFGGDLTGFFVGLIMSVHPSLLSRTLTPDTDVYSIFFPVMIVLFFLEGFEAENLKKGLIFMSIAGLFCGLYSFTWGGWWFLFDLLLAALGIVLLHRIIEDMFHQKKKGRGFKLPFEKLKIPIILGLVFIVSSAIFVSIFLEPSSLQNALSGPLGRLHIKDAAKVSYWPNVFTTVAELNPASIKTAINNLGGNFFFGLALLGVLFTLRKKEDGTRDIKYAIILIIWFAGTIFMTTKGVRFLLLTTPAFCIALGIFFGSFYKILVKWISKLIDAKKGLIISGIKAICILFFLLLLGFSPIPKCNEQGCSFMAFGMAAQAKASVNGRVPLINDAWVESLQNIDTIAAPDAIVNSWWDYGHWFKYWADRAVTFDGASQNSPPAHWVGKVLSTDNEDLAVGILRMLDCGSNDAYDYLFKTLKVHPLDAVEIFNEILVVDRDEAKEILKDWDISDKDIDNILELSHCEPPENYFITSQDMVGKAGVWAHFGNWNFTKAFIWQNTKGKTAAEAIDLIVDELGYSEEKANDIYYEVSGLIGEDQANAWISPWPNFLSATLRPCNLESDNETLICRHNTQISRDSRQSVNLDSIEINLSAPSESKLKFVGRDRQSGVVVGESEGKPSAVIIIKNNELFEYKSNGTTFDYDFVVMQGSDGSYGCLGAHPLLAKSLFARLFYFNGAATKHFEPISEKQAINGEKIIVWKVNWEGIEKPIIEEIEEDSDTESDNEIELVELEEETASNETDSESESDGIIADTETTELNESNDSEDDLEDSDNVIDNETSESDISYVGNESNESN